MRSKAMGRLVVCASLVVGLGIASAQVPDDRLISPSRPVPVGKAPGMQVKLVMDTPQQKVYAVVFYKGDEALSGLTDFAIKYGVGDAHFTGIGAVSGATVAWLDAPN